MLFNSSDFFLKSIFEVVGALRLFFVFLSFHSNFFDISDKVVIHVYIFSLDMLILELLDPFKKFPFLFLLIIKLLFFDPEFFIILLIVLETRPLEIIGIDSILLDHLFQSFNLVSVLFEKSVFGILINDWLILDELSPRRVS